jgi:hypothetical protein
MGAKGASDTTGANATLVCDSGMGDGGTDVCTDLLTGQSDRYVLWVTFTDSPDECLRRLPAVPADRTGVISAGGTTRSTAAAGEAGGGATVISDPSDLTGLMIAIDRYLDRHHEVALCFDSVTMLLQYASTKRAYEFLNSLTGRLWRADVDAHFHVDPDAVQASTLQHVASLLDDRVDLEDGA